MSRPAPNGESYGYIANRRGVASVAQSAKIVVPLIHRMFSPQRVLDVGCGAGDWLWVFAQNGVAEVCGCDGSWVPISSLKIPENCFHRTDFYSKIPSLGRFDLSMCLEVAEHVSPEIAEKLIDLVCTSADVVLWSAAVPGQGGVEHINERYQDYWIDLFLSRGFRAFDLIRPKIWMNEKVSWWYQQNCLVFANDVAREEYSLTVEPFVPSLIHPFLYERTRDPRNYSLRKILQCLPHYVSRRFRRSMPLARD